MSFQKRPRTSARHRNTLNLKPNKMSTSVGMTEIFDFEVGEYKSCNQYIHIVKLRNKIELNSKNGLPQSCKCTLSQ